MGRLNRNQMHLRGGTICGAQMTIDSMAAISVVTNFSATNSGAESGGLVSTT